MAIDFEPGPTATRETLEALRDRLRAIAAEHGIMALRSTPEGRLYGSVDYTRPWGGMFAFEQAVEERLGLRVEFVPDGALDNPGNNDRDRLRPL